MKKEKNQEVIKPKVIENESPTAIIEVTHVPNTPLAKVVTAEGGNYLMIGKTRLTQKLTADEVEKEIKNPSWEVIFGAIEAIWQFTEQQKMK